MLRATLQGVAATLAALALAACASTGPSPGPATGSSPAPASSDSASSTGAVVPAGLPDAGSSAGDENIDGYRLGQGDRIAIQVFDEPDLTMEAGVNTTGTISYSYLGDIRVANKTTDQIEDEITTLLSDGYLRNPSVNVSIVQFRPFFINGEVNSPGGYPYQPGLTLDRAIALAGGLTDRASTRKMFVIQAGGDQEEVKAGMSTKLAPGDIVSIKEGFF